MLALTNPILKFPSKHRFFRLQGPLLFWLTGTDNLDEKKFTKLKKKNQIVSNFGNPQLTNN